MKAANLILCVFILLFSVSCVNKEKKQKEAITAEADQLFIPIDKGFSEYISSYTSGIIPANASIEIRFTPEFAARADKKKLTGLFVFEPAIKGKAEWIDDLTLVFRPARILDPGKPIPES